MNNVNIWTSIVPMKKKAISSLLGALNHKCYGLR